MIPRKYLQFSTRSMLVLFFLGAPFLGWIAAWYRGAVREQAVASSLAIHISESKYCGPTWLEPVLGEWEMFTRAESIRVLPWAQAEKWNAIFREFNYVEFCWFSSDFADDESLEGIEKWRHLQRLAISGEKFTAEALKRLSRSKLQHLTLASMDLDRASLTTIRELPRIEIVELFDCRFQDARDLSILVDCEKIKYLDVRRTTICPEVIKWLELRRPDIYLSLE